jgi:enoyl-CoA hydratase/carnithine racemase
VTLNRPERLNAIDGSLINAMDDALDALSTGEFRAAILTGAGRGFCAGADLSGTGEAWTRSASESPAFKINYDAQVRLADLYTRLYELPIPVIAAVGGGLAFALHCDIRIASGKARFGFHQGGVLVDGHGHQLPAAKDPRSRGGAGTDADRPHHRRRRVIPDQAGAGDGGAG